MFTFLFNHNFTHFLYQEILFTIVKDSKKIKPKELIERKSCAAKI